MKRLFLLMGLLLAFATPTFAQPKTDTIRMEFRANNYMFIAFSFNGTENGVFKVDWGDGNTENITIMDEYYESVTHTYEPSDSYKTYKIRLYATNLDARIISLYLDHNTSVRLTSLDVSGCTALTELFCSNNRLTSLDLSKNTSLAELDCDYNQLTSLDLSKNTSLAELDCTSNMLTSLNVSGCTALTRLGCNYNRLTSLDLSGCIALTYLNCDHNQLTSLDLSKNTSLAGLDCTSNMLTSLNVSGCTALTYLLDCRFNQLTSLDVSNCTALTSLVCSYNQLTSLDVSNCTALTSLDCNDNQLTSLDVSNCTALTSLDCSYNQIPLTQLYQAYTKVRSFSASGQSARISLLTDQDLDLSSEKILGGATSTFELFNYGDIVSSNDFTENEFIFQFHKTGEYSLELQNPNLFDITFMWYISVMNETFTISLASNNPDWGDVDYKGSSTVEKGEEVTIYAFPNEGYRFINWTKKDGSVFSTDSVHTFAVMENLELTASFAPGNVANENFEADNLYIYAQDRTIYLSENRGLVQVFNTLGQCVYSGTATAIPVPQSGLYIVRVGTHSHKVLVR